MLLLHLVLPEGSWKNDSVTCPITNGGVFLLPAIAVMTNANSLLCLPSDALCYALQI